MKIKILLSLFFVIYLLQSQISSCTNASVPATGQTPVKIFYEQQTDTLLQQLTILDSAVVAGMEPELVQKQFKKCRFIYKKIEAISEYYFQGLTKRINGPALPDVRTEDGQVWPPHGFQVIEQALFAGDDNMRAGTSAEIKLLKTDLLFMRKNMEYNAISAIHVRELIQHHFIRIASLGITGFDAPLSKNSLEEAVYSIDGIKEITQAYSGKIESIVRPLNNALAFLRSTPFDTFDRLAFITDHLMPLSEIFYTIPCAADRSDSLMVKPFNGTFNQFMKGEGFNADYYSSYAAAKSSVDKIALGKKLFFDRALSKSGELSCGSCHKPDLYFSDGKVKSGSEVHGNNFLRNSPGLLYSGLQAGQFYDLRSVTLEDQADQVMRSSNEFNFSSLNIVKKLSLDSNYKNLFKEVFDLQNDTINGFHVRNAIAAFVRSLSPFSSPFDDYVKGNKNSLSADQIRGFNLFAGKAKCATCHFVPLFNGTIPPWLTKSESEIIGVPDKPVWVKASIDRDSGRYKINRMEELMFAFKTPTVRNVEKTGPYMHNGVYSTLDDVVEFYHKGGGVGIGIDLPFQSLPFDSLSLTGKEKKDIISFMKSLTDREVRGER